MTAFTYNNGVPASGNDPSVDQPDMLTNTQSIDSIIDVDHVGFGTANGGFHRRVRIINGATPFALGVTLTSAIGTAEAALFTQADASANTYRLTRTSDANYTEFGTNDDYDAGAPVQLGGWTFLPGGLLYQYGTTADLVSGANAVTYPFEFTNAPFNVQISIYEDSVNDEKRITVRQTNFSKTGFEIQNSGGTAGIKVFWTAIGV